MSNHEKRLAASVLVLSLICGALTGCGRATRSLAPEVPDNAAQSTTEPAGAHEITMNAVTAVPMPPANLSPNGTTVASWVSGTVSVTTALSWDAVSGATSYTVEVHKNTESGTLVMSKTFSSTSSRVSTSVTCTAPGTLVWRVRANNGTGSSYWNIAIFYVRCPVGATPGTPVIYSCGMSTTSLAFLCTAQTASAPYWSTSYYGELYKGSICTGTPFKTATSSTGGVRFDGLTSKTTYTCRIRAIARSSCGESISGSWSLNKWTATTN
jgi:hypothetical protein